MRFTYYIALVCVALLGGMIYASVVHAGATPSAPSATPANPEMPATRGDTYYPSGRVESTNLTYVPLEPLPGIDQSGGAQFGDLVAGFFRILINIGAFVAVTVLVIGGITYMVSEATVNKFIAKEKIKAAFFGLAILAGAWLILNTINPELLKFKRDLLDPAPSYVFILDSPDVARDAAIQTRANQAERELLQQKTDTVVKNSSNQPLTLRVDGARTEANLKAIEEFVIKCEEEHGGEAVRTDLVSPGATNMPMLWTCDKI